MSVLTITAPIAPAAVAGQNVSPSGDNASLANLATVDPREIAVVPAGAVARIDYDLGAPFGVAPSVDSFFIGYHTALKAAQTVTFQQISGMGGNVVAATPAVTLPLFASSAPLHCSYRLPQPWQARFVRAVIDNSAGSSSLSAGLFSAGLAFQPQWPFEYGSGRPIIDTGTAQRLAGGGFGIDQGVVAGGFQWQFADLNRDELARLYALLKSRGTTRPVWVVEDPDQTAGLNERTHYGLFTKIEPYERVDVDRSRLALQMEDWA